MAGDAPVEMRRLIAAIVLPMLEAGRLLKRRVVRGMRERWGVREPKTCVIFVKWYCLQSCDCS